MKVEKRSPGETIKAIRLKRGKTQQEVADAVNVSAAAVSRWEKGTRQVPIEMFESILEYLSAEYRVKY